MGQKYVPSIKDLKANQRFQQKQNPMPHFKKSSKGASGKKSRRK